MKTILNLPMNILRSFFSAISQFFSSIFGAITQFFAFIYKQIVALFNLFKLPMATSINSMRGLVIAFLVGLFVAIVAVGVQPFGLSEFGHESKTLYLIGFGVVAFVGMLIAKFALPQVLKNFYDTQSWTVARQVIHLSLVIIIIGALIVAYSNFFNISTFTYLDVLKALALCIIPAVIVTFIQQNMFHNKFTSAADNINSNLKSFTPPSSTQILPVLVFGEGCLGLEAEREDFFDFLHLAFGGGFGFWVGGVGGREEGGYRDKGKQRVAQGGHFHTGERAMEGHGFSDQ